MTAPGTSAAFVIDMLLRSWRLIAILLVALSLGASFAHVLELPAKLMLAANDYLLVQSIYRYFGPVASVLEPLSIVALIGLVILTRHRPSFALGVVALIALVLSLITWFAVVSPMNTEMASWAGELPATWTATRERWEWGHVAVFGLKLVALLALVASVLIEIPAKDTHPAEPIAP